MKILRQMLIVGLFGLLAMPAAAELGDYSSFRTALNLISPPRADNPVTDADRQGLYPLPEFPAGYNSGFKPGNYYAWQTITLPPETGAACGNGSPYRFFVNRVPNTSNTVVYLEGGGACWDHASCSGKTGIRGARNPDGIPADYMSLLNPGASLVTPFVVRLHPFDRVKTQNWNMIYVPYCTGDLYSGDKVAVYEDPTGESEPLVWHHNGLRNNLAMLAWIKNNLQRPAQMLMTGCSAGGGGSLNNFYPVRKGLKPDRAFLLNDSGPIFTAPLGGDPQQYPSAPLHAHIRDAWGLDGPNGPLAYMKSVMPTLDLSDLGTVYPALATALPGDRLGHTHFWDDLNYSSYSYERFHDDIEAAPGQAAREALIRQKWHQDTERMAAQMANLPNVGYYLPRFRDFNESHCTSILSFADSDIQEMGLELRDFVDNLLNGQGAVMQASETDTQADRQKPFNPIFMLVDQLLSGGI